MGWALNGRFPPEAGGDDAGTGPPPFGRRD
jgi:hypothetical protein